MQHCCFEVLDRQKRRAKREAWRHAQHGRIVAPSPSLCGLLVLGDTPWPFVGKGTGGAFCPVFAGRVLGQGVGRRVGLAVLWGCRIPSPHCCSSGSTSLPNTSPGVSLALNVSQLSGVTPITIRSGCTHPICATVTPCVTHSLSPHVCHSLPMSATVTSFVPLSTPCVPWSSSPHVSHDHPMFATITPCVLRSLSPHVCHCHPICAMVTPCVPQSLLPHVCHSHPMCATIIPCVPRSLSPHVCHGLPMFATITPCVPQSLSPHVCHQCTEGTDPSPWGS